MNIILAKPDLKSSFKLLEPVIIERPLHLAHIFIHLTYCQISIINTK
jgi:hypothetical protein